MNRCQNLSLTLVAVLAIGLMACGESEPGTSNPPAPSTEAGPPPAPPPGTEAGLPPAPPPGTDHGLPPAPPPDRDGGAPPPPPSVDQGQTPPLPAPPCDAALEKNACGGSLAGTYIYKEACASEAIVAPLAAFCPGVTASNITALSKGGTLTFTGASYQLSTSTDVAFTLKVPPACAAMTCQTVEVAIVSALTSNGAAGGKATCSGGLTGCSCAVSYNLKLASAGLFSTAGGVATLASGAQYWYCVKSGGLLYKGKVNASDVGIAYSLSR